MAKTKRTGQTTQWPKQKEQDRQHNGQNKKNKQWSTKHYIKTKDRATRTLLKFEVNSCASESQAVPAPLVTPLKYVTNMYPTRFMQLALQCEGVIT